MHGTIRVIYIHCLYLAELNLVLRLGDIAKLAERWNNDIKIAGSISLYAIIFLPTIFTCWYTS